MSFLSFGMSVQCKNKGHINQDKFGSVTVRSPAGKEIIVAAVADGVSLCFKGEVASYNTVRYVLNWGAEYFSQNEFDSSAIPDEFDKLIISINQVLNHYATSNNKKKPQDGYSPYSSTTLSCAISDGDDILYFSIGDSTMYELKTYTTVNIMGKSKHTNTIGQLTSYIGGINDNKLDIRFISSKYNDSSAYLLCTDGMSNRIVFNIETNENFRKFNQRLLAVDSKSKGITVLEGMADYVVEKGETDDITALVIKRVKGQ
jgi:serine/threonine protein phosphatase PrpC